MDLDELARTARDELRHSVASVPVPMEMPRRRPVVLSFAVAVVVVALAVGVFARRGGDDVVRTDRPDLPPPRYFVLDGVPGLRPQKITVSGAYVPPTLAAYFGEPNRTNPFERVDLWVALTATTPDPSTWMQNARSVQVGDATGLYLESDDDAAVYFRRGGAQVVASSKTLRGDALVEAASVIVVDGNGIRLSRVTKGLEPIGEREFPFPFERVTTYSRSDDARVAIESTRGGPGSLDVLRWDGAEPTTVGRRPAMRQVGSGPGGPTAQTSLSWQLEDGTVLTLRGTIPEDELRALVDAVREVDEAEWRRIAR